MGFRCHASPFLHHLIEIGYLREMEKPAATGFDIHIAGIWRAFRDQKPAAYEAAVTLKKRNKDAAVTIASTATGVVVTMLEDGRTA